MLSTDKIVSYFLLSFSCVSTTPEPTTPPPTVPEFKRKGGKKCKNMAGKNTKN
jgi:hypothetical protein